MTWAKTTTADKYRSAEHRTRRDALVRRINAGERVDCTAKVCLFDRAPITNTDGRARDGLHLGHEDNGTDYAGAQHGACNIHDAAVRAAAKSHEQQTPEPHRWAF